MPHFGLMDEGALGPVEGPFQRARLHIRGGRRRLRQGKISAGIVTLYDALSAAMQWYIASPEREQSVKVNEGEDIRDDETAYRVLVRSKVLDGSFDYQAFDSLVVRALNEELADYDYHQVLKGIESVMTQLGVMPFDEAGLPAEDPSTF
ncbi:MAG TPA: hypothetical protein VFG09_11680 [Thermodesulfovibrionales bacterium]|nr:hypothetical protein [Thermodesulfovibrionales bacterium]